VRRFKKCGWDHVLFHGGVPSGKRKDLVDRFREDPKCRAFLATDAGGTGLNLQHASVVMNMDLPWNPAVLEQRIGRVHRLGQRQPVRVINFVAQGTIEQGMLDVIKFKKSLFAGVLDQGEKDVFLGGSRLNKFMEQVEAATSAIPEAMLEDAEEALREAPREFEDEAPWQRDGKQQRRPRRGQRGAEPARSPVPAAAALAADEEDESPAAASPTSADPWSSLLQTGMALLQQIATASPAAGGRPAGASASGLAGMASSFLNRDERTGETYLKVPVAKPEVFNQAVQALGMFLDSLQK
jgi:superfamily II DNA/RNA helicase